MNPILLGIIAPWQIIFVISMIAVVLITLAILFLKRKKD